MTDSFVYQANLKAGNDLLNIRADDAEAFAARIDALFGEGASVQVLARFFGFLPEQTSPEPFRTSVGPAAAIPAPAVPVSTSTCPQCGVGQVVTKNRKDGKGTFQGCNNYPACNYIARGR